MVKRIELYVEGDDKPHKHQVIALREGFHEFFRSIKDRARQHGGDFRAIPSGAKACGDFLTAVQLPRNHADIFIAILIDSEGPLGKQSPGEFLKKRCWRNRQVSVAPEQCHLKTKHAPELLRLIDSAKVRRFAPHCERLFQTLEGVLT